MNHSRRNFIKNMGVGTAGILLAANIVNGSALISPNILDKNELSNLRIDTRNFTPVFPVPQKAEYREGTFTISDDTTILLSQYPSEHDVFLARELRAELAEKYGIIAALVKTASLKSKSNYIVMGSSDNPLVQEAVKKGNAKVSDESIKEGYTLEVNKNFIVINGTDKAGAFYGLQSLRQMINYYGPSKVRCAAISDWPYKPFRGIRIFLPGPENIAFYKRFIRDFMARYKYNKIILETNACMRLDNHPELNAGSIEFYKELIYTRRSRVTGPHEQIQDSTHHDCADGEILDKAQVADLVAYARKYQIETIPEIPALSHVYYLLNRHRELAEIKNAEWPDSYCASNPDSRKLYFDVLEEYIDVMQPKMIHIGHDEWRMPTHVCEKCKDADYKELFIEDVLAIHDFLKKRNIRTAMWGDHLLQKRRTTKLRPRTSPTGYEYTMPGAITDEQLKSRIPKDILIFNWSWKKHKSDNGRGIENEQQLSNSGLEQVFGNFETMIQDYEERSKLEGIIGGAPSAWVATNELNFGKINLHKFVGCSNLLWSTHYHQSHEELARFLQIQMPTLRNGLKGRKKPSDDNNPLEVISLIPAFNSRENDNPENIPLHLLKNNKVNTGNKFFNLEKDVNHYCAVVAGTRGKTGTALPVASKKIDVSRDVSSLIFMHTCAHPSDNVNGFFKIHNAADTADLLGWYKIVYEDGLIETIPIRYGINIREWHIWGVDPQTGKPDRTFFKPYYNGRGSFCYEGDVINCSDNNTEFNFFAFEWQNPRLGKVIKEVYLEGSNQFKNASGEIIDSNAIALVGLSCTVKRDERYEKAKYGN